MNPKKHYSNQTKLLGSMCDNKTPLAGKIAILSAESKDSSDITNKIIIFGDYAQLIILAFFSNFRVYGNVSNQRIDLFTAFYQVMVISTPGYLVTYAEGFITQVLVSFYACIFTFVLRILLFFYIVYVAKTDREGDKRLISIWRVIFKTQARILYYFIGSFYFTMIDNTLHDNLGFSYSKKCLYVVLSAIMVSLEFGFGLFLELQFKGLLPSKSFLASKNNVTEIITLIQKYFNQVVRRILIFRPDIAIWIVNIVDLVLSLIRLKYYFDYLPPYRISALKYQLWFLVPIVCLNVASLFQTILQHEEFANMNFVFVLWVCLAILMTRAALSYLEKKMLRLAFENKDLAAEALIHKLAVIKYLLKKESLPSQLTEKSRMTYLAVKALNSRINVTFGLSLADSKLNLEDKESRNELFTLYLESLLARFPRNDFIRLYTAYHYAEKHRMYGLCIKTLGDLRHSKSKRIIVSTSLLFEDIKNIIIKDYQNGEYLFDISNYAKNMALVGKIKVLASEQAGLQAELYKEIQGLSNPDLRKISDMGFEMSKKRKRIERKINQMKTTIPESYLEPLIICAHYYLVVTHSYQKYLKFNEAYLKKAERFFSKVNQKVNKFCQENLYKEDIGLIILSGEKHQMGQILYSGGNSEEILGKNMAGSHISLIMPPSIRYSTNQLLKGVFEKGSLDLVDKIKTNFLYNIRGYMTPVSYYANLNPHTPHGLAYYMLFQVVKTSRESLLIGRNGNIESFTRGIGEKLGLLNGNLKNGNTNIRELNERFEEINQELNAIADKGLEDNEEKEGVVLRLKKIGYEECWSYKCSVKNFDLRATKIVTLEPAEPEEAEEELSLEDSTFTTKGVNNNEENLSETDREFKWTIDSPKVMFETYHHFPRNIQNQMTSTTIKTQMVSERKTLIKTLNLITTSRDSIAFEGIETTTRNERLLSQYNEKKRSQTRDQNHGSFYDLLDHEQSLKSLKHPQWLTAGKIRFAKIFEEILNTTYYPKFYRVFVVLISVSMCAIVGLEVGLNVSNISNLEDLRTSKEILRTSEARTRYFVELNGYARTLYNFATGDLNITEYNSILVPEYIMNKISVLIPKIEDTDATIVSVSSSFETQDREQLFESNIQVFSANPYCDSTDYRYRTNLQVSSLIVQSSLKILSTFLISSSAVISNLNFVLCNTMNDLLIRDKAISNAFQKSFHEHINAASSTLSSFSLGILLVCILFIGLCAVTLYQQYKREKFNLSTLLKLNKDSILLNVEYLETFQEVVLRNTSFITSLQQEEEAISYLQRDNGSGLERLKNRAKKADMNNPQQSPKVGGLQVDYFLFFLKITLTVFMSLVLTGAEFFLLRKNFKNLNEKGDEIHFLDQMNSEMAVIAIGLFEVIATNDTTLIRNENAITVVKDKIQDISGMISGLTNYFNNNDDDENSQEASVIKEILFKDACLYLEGDVRPYNFCKVYSANQQNFGMVSFLSKTEAQLNTILNAFESSDKSAAVLTNLQVQISLNILPATVLVMQNLVVLITNSLDGNFNNIAARIEDINLEQTILFFVVLGVQCLIFYFFVWKKLKKNENKFKDLLKFFPGEIVVSNFMIKSYLMKMSKENLDY